MSGSPIEDSAAVTDTDTATSIEVLRSPTLEGAGFRHGFSTRGGGVSDAPFDSLNLGVAGAPGAPDPLERIMENRQRFGRAVGGADRDDLPWVLSRQVHGNEVHWSEGEIADPRDLERLPIADAIVGRESGRLLSVRTADCLPILLACPRSGLAAAVHAGWRGLVVGTIPTAIDTMAARGASRDAIVAAIGPAISVAHYEVGDEVIEAFADAGVPVAHRAASEPETRSHLDLAGTACAVLGRCGVDEDRIDVVACCTFAEPDRFFSYRRDGARSGRLAAVIEPRG